MKLVLKNIFKFILLTLLLLYSLQADVFGAGSPISMISVTILMVIQVFVFVLSFKYIKTPVINSLYLIVFLSTIAFIYAVLSEPFVTGAHKSQILVIFYISSFVIMTFYLTKKNIIVERDMIIFYIVYLIRTIIVNLIQIDEMATLHHAETVTNNIGYAFVSILPFVFLLKKKTTQIFLLFIMLTFILASFKRGAIVVGLFFIGFYFLSISKQIKINFYNFFLILSVLFLFVYYMYDFYLNNDFLQYRIKLALAGNVSHRDVIYRDLWRYYLDSDSFFHYFFGFGIATSIKVTGLYAHNDWLELLLQNGLIGVIVYLTFFVQLFKMFLNSEVLIRYKLGLMSLFIMWILQTLFTMVLTSIGTAPTAILLGYLVAKKDIVNIDKENVLSVSKKTI